MELTNQEIRFNLLISNIQQLKDQTGELKTILTGINKKPTGETAMSQMGKEIDANAQKLKSYESQLAQLRQQGARSFMVGDGEGFKKAKTDFDALNGKMVDFNKQWGIFNRGFYESGNTVDYFFAKLRSHASWLATGLAMTALISIPDQMMDIAKQTEVWNQKIRQNLELTDKYHGAGENLNADLETIRQTAGLMAIAYGKPLNEVMEAQQIISRRFKDPSAILYFSNLAMTMSTLDFVPTTKAAQDLEAVILQFGLSSADASKFVDQFSVAVERCAA